MWGVGMTATRTLVVVCLFLCGGCASGQAILAAQAVRAACAPTSGSSSVDFQVVDHMGLVLPGVLVRLTAESAASRVAHSDAKGWVSIEAPVPGRYDAKLELPGFRSVRVEGIEVASKCQVKLLVAMKVSGREEVVQ